MTSSKTVASSSNSSITMASSHTAALLHRARGIKQVGVLKKKKEKTVKEIEMKQIPVKRRGWSWGWERMIGKLVNSEWERELSWEEAWYFASHRTNVKDFFSQWRRIELWWHSFSYIRCSFLHFSSWTATWCSIQAWWLCIATIPLKKFILPDLEAPLLLLIVARSLLSQLKVLRGVMSPAT